MPFARSHIAALLTAASSRPQLGHNKGENNTMTRKPTMKTFAFALMAVAGFAVLSVGWDAGVASVSASSDKGRKLHVTKECGNYDGTAGSFCTITSSNLEQLKVGST